jgi:uncharacterized membrane protein
LIRSSEGQFALSTPWFRARGNGLGWTPVTWQGWLVTVGSALAVMVLNLLVVAQITGPRS